MPYRKGLQWEKLPNVHVVELTITFRKTAEIRLRSQRFKHSVYIERDYDYTYWYEQGLDWLKENGFNVIYLGEGTGCMYAMTDTFEPLK